MLSFTGFFFSKTISSKFFFLLVFLLSKNEFISNFLQNQFQIFPLKILNLSDKAFKKHKPAQIQMLKESKEYWLLRP